MKKKMLWKTVSLVSAVVLAASGAIMNMPAGNVSAAEKSVSISIDTDGEGREEQGKKQ